MANIGTVISGDPAAGGTPVTGTATQGVAPPTMVQGPPPPGSPPGTIGRLSDGTMVVVGADGTTGPAPPGTQYTFVMDGQPRLSVVGANGQGIIAEPGYPIPQPGQTPSQYFVQTHPDFAKQNPAGAQAMMDPNYKPPGDEFKTFVNGVTGAVKDAVGGIGDALTPAKVDTGQVQSQIDKANAITQDLQNKTAAGGTPGAATVVPKVAPVGDYQTPQTKAVDLRGTGPNEPQGEGFGGTSVVNMPGDIIARQAAEPKFNAAQPNESRGTFVDSVNMAKDAAEGKGPSGASIQAALDIDRATKQANALAAAHQGRSVGGALVAGVNAASNAAINIDAQAQAAKAKEMEAARGQYLTGAGQVAGLDVNRELALSELGTKTGIANAQLGTQAAISTGELNLKAEQGNQATDLAARDITARLGTESTIANADRDARTQVIVKDLQLRAAQGDQDAILKMKALDDARYANDQDAFIKALAIATEAATAKAQIEAGTVANQNQYKGSIIGTGGTILTALL